jgi:hypothetical protein
VEYMSAFSYFGVSTCTWRTDKGSLRQLRCTEVSMYRSLNVQKSQCTEASMVYDWGAAWYRRGSFVSYSVADVTELTLA